MLQFRDFSLSASVYVRNYLIRSCCSTCNFGLAAPAAVSRRGRAKNNGRLIRIRRRERFWQSQESGYGRPRGPQEEKRQCTAVTINLASGGFVKTRANPTSYFLRIVSCLVQGTSHMAHFCMFAKHVVVHDIMSIRCSAAFAPSPTLHFPPL